MPCYQQYYTGQQLSGGALYAVLDHEHVHETLVLDRERVPFLACGVHLARGTTARGRRRERCFGSPIVWHDACRAREGAVCDGYDARGAGARGGRARTHSIGCEGHGTQWHGGHIVRCTLTLA